MSKKKSLQHYVSCDGTAESIKDLLKAPSTLEVVFYYGYSKIQQEVYLVKTKKKTPFCMVFVDNAGPDASQATWYSLKKACQQFAELEESFGKPVIMWYSWE